MNDRPCDTCSARGRLTEVRDNGFVPVDPTLGLTHIGDERYACPACGLRYRRTLDPATMFHDYDQYLFEKLDMPVGTKRVVVIRCPECGSTNAGADESKSAYDFTHMQCHACGQGGLVDSWQRDFDWTLEIERTATPAFGCARCFGDDASTAWEAAQTQRVRSLLQEPHFGVHLTECSCGQAFAVVFTERIDFRDGEDEQDWLVVPLTLGDRSELTAALESEVPRLITELGRERRFLVRSHASGAAVRAGWRSGGLAIGRHD